eukprot:CAMPEP_0197602048 /NCGR_PEP_ID=MMETSP1326-20131121/36436_1 /TAXON_ID=1155430 /ORGANISM="Genus nov. species nov., Strain RCC2288" /LENGTH=678 /DNA_ID=CAMNT_0043169345 /DNA_START=10 /DNA_END=2043 /DNA_ORIENTATION=-
MNAAASIADAVDVSTINRLLQDVMQTERNLQRELFDTLGKKDQITERLTRHQMSSATLESIRNGSTRLHSDVLEMSALANVVSDQVRKLDTEQSSVQSTIIRVVLNVDMATCLDGIKNSLECDEYEAAAGFVEEALVNCVANENKSAQFNQALEAVAGVLRDKISSAAVKGEVEQVLRFGKLFPKVGLSQEGLQKICQYLCKRITEQSNQDRVSSTQPSSSDDGVSRTLMLLSELFRSIVSCIEQHSDVLVDTFGSIGLETLIRNLNKECDVCGSHLLKRYMDMRNKNIFQSAKDVQTRSLDSEENVVDPRVIEEYLEEIISMCQISRQYNRWLHDKLTDGQHNDAQVTNTNTFHGDHYNRSLQDVMGFYIKLEEIYLYENVALAIRINDEQVDSLSSSMVDDIFYILQKCARRATETGSIQAVCASLNHINNILTGEVHGATRNDLQHADLNFLEGVLSTSSNDPKIAKKQPKSATAINNADVIADNILVLKQEIEATLGSISGFSSDRERIKSCLHELQEICGIFRQISREALMELIQGILMYIRPVFDTLAALSYEMDETQYSEHEDCDPWMHQLLVQLEEKVLLGLRPHFVSSSFNVLIGLFAEALATRLEGIILTELRFSQLGGLQFEREIRRLILHLSSAFPHAAVREKFARLSEIATILNVENPGEIAEYW